MPRYIVSLLLVLCLGDLAAAQAPVKFSAVRVGFPSYTADDSSRPVTAWTP